LLSVYIVYSHVAVPGMCLRRNIFVPNGKELCFIIDKMCAEYFKGLLGKEKKTKTSKTEIYTA
jgi:hypothetical protein